VTALLQQEEHPQGFRIIKSETGIHTEHEIQ
jgi:hypothetical protein